MTDNDIATTDLDGFVGEPYQEMLRELRAHHGADIDAHLRGLVRDGIHESYKELDAE
jgi:hypothetical protein